MDHEGFYVVTQPHFTVPELAAGAELYKVHITLESVHELSTVVDVKAQAGLTDVDRVTPQATLSSRTLYDVPFPNQNSLRNGLRLVPGVIQDGTWELHFFGGAENQAQYSFIGFQLNDAITGRFDARMSLEAVEAVEVQAAPADASMGRGTWATVLLPARIGTDETKYSVTEFFPRLQFGSGANLSRWSPRAYFSGPWKKHRAWFFNTAEFQFVRLRVNQLPGGQDSSSSWTFNDLLHNQINLSNRNILFAGLLFDYQYSPYSGLSLADPRSVTLRREAGQWFGYIKDQWSFSHSSLIEVGICRQLHACHSYPPGFSDV